MREAERWLPQVKLALRAWRDALDPRTATWVDQARHSDAASSPEEAQIDLERGIEAARDRL
jgi:hypothetical protein